MNDQNPLLDSLTKSSLLNLDSFSLSSPEASSGQTRASGKKSQISAFLDDASLPATNPENILLSPNRDTFSDIKSVSSSQRTSYHAEPFLQPPPSSSVSTSSTGLLTLPSLHHTESLQEDSSSPSLKIQALGSITLENAAPSLDQVNLGQHSVLSSCSGGGGGSIYSKVLDSESSSLQCLNEISVLKEPIPLKVLPLPSLSSSSSSSIPLRVLLPTSPQQLQPHHHHQPQAQSIQYFPETQVITTQPMMTAFSTNQIMQDQQKRAPPILIPSASQQACISWQQQKQHVYLRNKNELKLDNGETKRERNPKIELINCYKCAECGFLGLSSSAVQEHLLLEHVKEDGADAGDENGNKWVSIAIQQGIQMLCPFCDNKFNAEGPRSFKTHVIDDHGVNEEEAHGYWLVGFKNRKAATIEYLKKKRDQEREEEKKRLQREVLEAYVDPDGHLRVRAVDIKDSLRSVTVDVSAQEYVDAVKVSRKIQQSSKKTKTSNSFHENEMTPIANQKLLLAKLVGRSCKPTRSSEVGSILKNSKSKDPEQVMILQSNEDTESGQTGHQGKKEIKKIRNAGRPKGSKSIGFSKLKRLNSTIRLCDEGTGTLCSQPNCGIRMRNQDKLEYHERTHLEEPKEKEGDVRSSSFVCPECKDKFRQWSDLSLHLWKQHQLNMELLACEECSSFKAYSLAKLQSHRLTHVEERLFLCDQCPKNFKTSRNLSHHKLKKHSNDKSESSVTKLKDIFCPVCARKFKEARQLRHHLDSVHEKVKPHLCNFCGYSGTVLNNYTFIHRALSHRSLDLDASLF